MVIQVEFGKQLKKYFQLLRGNEKIGSASRSKQRRSVAFPSPPLAPWLTWFLFPSLNSPFGI